MNNELDERLNLAHYYLYSTCYSDSEKSPLHADFLDKESADTIFTALTLLFVVFPNEYGDIASLSIGDDENNAIPYKHWRRGQ